MSTVHEMRNCTGVQYVPVEVSSMQTANLLHWSTFSALQPQIVVEAILLELDIYVFEVHDNSLRIGSRIGRFDM